METQLYVHTGTGNSLWVARQLALELREATVEFLPGLSADFTVGADRVGIFFPVHIWGLPRRVIRFVDHLRVKPGTHIFGVAVNAGQVAATLLQLRRLLSTRGLSLASGYSIAMPSNYIPWGGPGPVETQQRLFSEAREKINVIAGSVLRGERKEAESGPVWQNLLFSQIYRISFQRVPKLDKNFWVDSRCNHCGICSKVCPAKNIEMVNPVRNSSGALDSAGTILKSNPAAGQRSIVSNGVNETPSWLHQCDQCLACIQWCPREAIQYGKKTAKYPRYHHPEVTLKDMLDQAQT